uniref:protein kinase domain-containing protein n=1 Tax=Alloprevotella sp. TaxID=1872471 RepID=UPI00402559CD
MQYPLISEYVAAIRDAEDNLDTLKHLKPVTDKYGEPYRSSGAFAVVFKMTDERTGKCYALKCFTEEQDGRAEAYRQISEELEYCNSHYITSVKYLEEELYVDSNCEENEFPVLLMDWIDGETMEAYIAANYADKYAMSMLCYHFCQMAAWLRSQPFAHGDIKPDNIMVRPDGTLTLVDYDGMFVPSMKGRKSPTIGTKDFSHPLRTIDDFDENIDDFALSTIALSLKAISLSSSLFTEYGASDRLLFSATDYLDLSKSKAFAALNELLADEDLKTLMSMFLLANAKKDLSLCSFRLFRISGTNDTATILKYGDNYWNGWNGFEKNKHKAFVFDVEVDLDKSTDDYKKTFHKYNIIAEQGISEAQWRLGECYELGQGVAQDYGKAVEWYRKAAEQGDSNGQWRLGVCYEFGQGVDKDYGEAVEWYRKSAEQGDACGQWQLGSCYEFGQGVTQDYGKAVEWYRKSAEQGDSVGQWNLGYCYELGQGVDKDYGEAVEWYTKSAEQGDSEAQWRLGVCYYLGRGVDEDYGKAAEWYRKSAEQENSVAQWRLGVCYNLGRGVDKDYGKAAEWYRKSAEQGDSEAQWRLGVCYEFGRGVDKDYGKAAEWYRKSAEQGDSEAQWRLGVCYYLGR